MEFIECYLEEGLIICYDFGYTDTILRHKD